jgi:hypothetical protein
MDNKPLLKPAFAGAVDTVGGVILENIIKSTNTMGVIACVVMLPHQNLI